MLQNEQKVISGALIMVVTIIMLGSSYSSVPAMSTISNSSSQSICQKQDGSSTKDTGKGGSGDNNSRSSSRSDKTRSFTWFF